MYNGVSEMVDGVSYAIVALIFNLRMMFFLGEQGIGAFAVSEYVGGLFSAVFYGVSMSIVPVVGYHLGQQNKEELHSIRRSGLTLMGIFGITMTGLCLIFADPIARAFVGYNEEVSALAARGMRLVSLSYLLGGITVYSSSYFTGLNQGSASLIIAAMKGFFGPLAGVYLLPLLIGATGLWLAQPFAEVLALIAALLCYMWWSRDEDRRIREATAEDAV
jgi:Na+-driven multidrug efflux pump